MTKVNPYDPPEADSEIEQKALPTLREHGVRACVGRALLAGAGIGGCIGIARFFVEGFYVWGPVRDLLVGTTVGIVVGTVWFLIKAFAPVMSRVRSCE